MKQSPKPEDQNILKKNTSFIDQVFIKENIRGMGESPTLRINQRCKKLMSKGRHVYRLGLGQSPFPVPDPVVNALRLYASEKEYQHVQGLPALRQAVADFHRKKDGVDRMPEDVIIGPGSKELLFLIQLVFDGTIIIPSPGWVSYLPQARILNKAVLLLDTNFKEQWRITAELLESICQKHKNEKPFLLILNYPGNPDGITYGDKELYELAETARKNNVIILSDEIYGQLHHEGKHVSIAKYYPDGTIISSGLSKWCGAGGWRLGTFSFPRNLHWLMRAMSVVASETYTSVSAPIQFAAVQAFLCGAEIEDYLWHVRKILKELGRQTAEILCRAGLGLVLPTGGFYLFIDFSPFTLLMADRKIYTSSQLCEALLNECNVAILPGEDFNRPPGELTARLSYVDFDGARALKAAYTFPLHEPLPDDFIKQYCGNVLEAAQKIAGWVSNESFQHHDHPAR